MSELELYDSNLDGLDEVDALELLEVEPEVIDVPFEIVTPEPAELPVKRERTELAQQHDEIVEVEAWPIAKREPAELVTREPEPEQIVETEAWPITQHEVATESIVEYEQPTETVNGLWRWLAGDSKPAATTSASTSRFYRWRYVAEIDPNEPEDVTALRYFYLLHEYSTLEPEWCEADFIEWCDALSPEDRRLFVEAGREIARGGLVDHLDDDLTAAYERMAALEAEGDESSSPVDRLLSWLF